MQEASENCKTFHGKISCREAPTARNDIFETHSKLCSDVAFHENVVLIVPVMHLLRLFVRPI